MHEHPTEFYRFNIEENPKLLFDLVQILSYLLIVHFIPPLITFFSQLVWMTQRWCPGKLLSQKRPVAS